nr:MAG TPA: hypothetical protein [Caudoviricetes sp.]
MLAAAENASPARYRAAVFSGKEKRVNDEHFCYHLCICWRLCLPRGC